MIGDYEASFGIQDWGFRASTPNNELEVSFWLGGEGDTSMIGAPSVSDNEHDNIFSDESDRQNPKALHVRYVDGGGGNAVAGPDVSYHGLHDPAEPDSGLEEPIEDVIQDGYGFDESLQRLMQVTNNNEIHKTPGTAQSNKNNKNHYKCNKNNKNRMEHGKSEMISESRILSQEINNRNGKDERESNSKQNDGLNQNSSRVSQKHEAKTVTFAKDTEPHLSKSLNNDDDDDFRPDTIKVMTSNARGFFSKREAFEAIVIRESIDVLCISETFTTGTRFPEIKGFITYYRNRTERSCGGISILIREERANYVTKIDSGKLENEFLMLKFSNTKPALVMCIYYGTQQNTFGVSQVKFHISELFEALSPHIEAGVNIQLVGDFNLNLGNSEIPNNHPFMDATARIFLDILKDKGLSIMNTLSQDPITFVDKSHKPPKRCVLDLVITNQPDTISEFRTDDDSLDFTPFSIHRRKGKTSRTYSDHRSIIYSLRVGWCDRLRVKRNTIWNFKKPLGDLRFDIYSSNATPYLLEKVRSEDDINKVVKAFRDVMTKGKFVSYGKLSLTMRAEARVNDDMVWRNRIADVEKLHRQFEDMSEANQIYKIRKTILKGQRDQQVVAVKDVETGAMIDDPDEIMDHVIRFNVRNMDKVEPSQEVAETQRRKAAVIELMLRDEEVKKYPDKISWEVYIKVVKKIFAQKKAVFRDFIKSGASYKVAVYELMNRIYREEIMPEEAAITFLTQIWKRKGDPALLKNNRFIHGKMDLVKLFEKLVVEILAETMEAATPQIQAGSRKKRSTRDQLLKVVIMQKWAEARSTPLPLLMVDVQACFDKMRLDDVVHDVIEAGGDLKAVRVIRKFSDTTVIKLKGDRRGSEGDGVGAVIRGTLGQGSNFAPPGIGLCTSKSIMANMEGAEKSLARLGDVVIPPSCYVDDINAIPRNEAGLRDVCTRVGRAMEVISLKTHPDKTEVIVSGGSKKAQAMRDRLTSNPPLMQGNPVKLASDGMYLGMKVSQAGHRDTVDKTVKHRISKAWGRVADLKNAVNDARMRPTGWFKAAVTLSRAIIIPSLTYSADVWVLMNKATEKLLHKEYKSMLYIVFDIPTKTKWSSVLADTGLPNIMTVVDRLRINFMNHTLWRGGDVKLRELLLEEHKLMPERSMVTAINERCRHYGMPDVSDHELDKKLVKQQTRLKDETMIWLSNVASPVTKDVTAERLRQAARFLKLSKREAQALIALNAGSLKLLTAWGDYHEEQRCLAPMCDGDDELEHIKKCPFYDTKWENKFEGDVMMTSRYIVDIDLERRRRWKSKPLF